jgi:hypothetical protein
MSEQTKTPYKFARMKHSVGEAGSFHTQAIVNLLGFVG